MQDQFPKLKNRERKGFTLLRPENLWKWRLGLMACEVVVASVVPYLYQGPFSVIVRIKNCSIGFFYATGGCASYISWPWYSSNWDDFITAFFFNLGIILSFYIPAFIGIGTSIRTRFYVRNGLPVRRRVKWLAKASGAWYIVPSISSVLYDSLSTLSIPIMAIATLLIAACYTYLTFEHPRLKALDFFPRENSFGTKL